jgi:hypothetical protein
MLKKVAAGVLVIALSTFFLPSSIAATVSAAGDATSLCTQTVNDVTNVSVARSGAECIVTFAPTAAITYSWTRPSGITRFRVLMIGGGGGGGSNYGAGGGGGGFIETTTTITTSAISIYVGLGGKGSFNGNSSDAVSGENTTVTGNSTLTATGGGRGGSADLTANGANGGSGGGGGGVSGTGGSASAGQGYAGGSAVYSNGSDTVATGGGGGAGGAGENGSSGSVASGGSGGVGKASDITGSATYYAGGGGGGTHTGGTGTCGITALGGTGGGGRAGTCKANTSNTGNAGQAGSNGLGGGGGGGSIFTGRNSAQAYGGNGGSGVVIIRFSADSAPVITGPSNATGASSSISITENSTTVHSFTANETVSWSKSGSDEAFFSISASGVLTITERDFEVRADANSDNIYIVIISATDSLSQLTSQTLTVTITNQNESAAIYSITLSATPYKGISVTITLTLNTPGSVRFFANNKRIASCLSRVTNGTYGNASATCLWKPTTRGVVILSATAYPTDSSFATTNSDQTKVFVLNKTSTR